MSVSPAMRHFMGANKFAVLGSVMTDQSRWDNKVLRWYQARSLPVSAVRPAGAASKSADVDTTEAEGLPLLSSVRDIPDLSSTSISIIIHPAKGLPIVKDLFADPRNQPRALWFQPGAADETIGEWIAKEGLQDKVVWKGECVLVSGDEVLRDIGRETMSK